jgi:WD40 repeat protein
MTDPQFDPYRKWLGIPPKEQPPNHYRLLGIDLFESDPDVISNAADRQMVHVRSFQSGKYSELSQQILNELSAARVCLLTPEKKREYDEQLQATLAKKAPPPLPPRSGAPGASAPEPAQAAGPQLDVAPVPRPAPGRSAATRGPGAARAARRKRSNTGPVISAVALVVALVVVALWFMLRPAPEAATKSPEEVAREARRTQTPSSRRMPSRPIKKRNGDERPDPAARAAPEPSPEDPAEAEAREPDAPRPSPPTPVEEENVPLGEMAALEGHVFRVTGVGFTADGEFVLSGSEDKTVRLWDVAAGHELRKFTGMMRPVFAVALSSDGMNVAASGGKSTPPSEGVVRVWEVAGGQQITKMDAGPLKLVRGLAFSPDGHYLALAAADQTLRLVEFAKGEEIRRFMGHRDEVMCVAYSSGGSSLLSGSKDRTMRLWDVSTGQELQEFGPHEGAVRGVAFGPRTRLAASASEDGKVRLWVAETARLGRTLEGHSGPVHCVAFAPDGRRLASGGADGTIRIWGVPSGKQLTRFDAHEGGVEAVAFSPGGRRLVSGGMDTVVRVWGVPDDLPGATADDVDPMQDPADELLSSAGFGPEGDKWLVPELQKQQEVEATIRNNRFKRDFDELGEDPGRRAVLAQRLLRRGSKVADDPESAFVMLKLARRLAAQAADMDTALAAAEATGERFDVDEIELKIETLSSASEAVAATAGTAALIERMLAVTDEAVAADDFDGAGKLMIMAQALASKADDEAMAKRIAARSERVSEQRRAYEAVQQSLARLEDQPDDPEASRAVGAYYAWAKEDWARGLPYLARAADEQLRPLAERDMAGPETADEQLALAEGWWALAEASEEPAREAILRRAAHWYEQAEPELSGITQAKAQKRIQQVRAADQKEVELPLPEVEGLACREEPAKQELLAAYGGNASSEAAVKKALEWFVEHQRPDGSWNFNHCTPRFKNECSDPGSAEEATNAATALALLPFLGAGEGPRSKDYHKTITTGLQALVKGGQPVQPQVVAFYQREGRGFPSHALATMALCEASYFTRDKSARGIAQSAVNFVVLTQNPDGGWGDRPPIPPLETGDTSSTENTFWNVLALKTAQWAGLEVPEKVWPPVSDFLDSMAVRTDEEFGYQRVPTSTRVSPQATAAGLMARAYLGTDGRSQLRDYAERLADTGPGEAAPVAQLFVNQLLMRTCRGEPWSSWNPQVRDQLILKQESEGAEAGSWFPERARGSVRQGGRLFCTAVATLTLEAYYLQPPLEQPASAEE